MIPTIFYFFSICVTYVISRRQNIMFLYCKKSLEIGTWSGKSQEKVRKFHRLLPVETLNMILSLTYFNLNWCIFN